MDHGDLQAVKQKISKAVPAAEFSEIDYGWTVNVGIPGHSKRYVLSQVYRHAYTGHMLATDMGVKDIVESLQADLAALKQGAPTDDPAYPFWPNGFSEEMLDQVIEMATMAAIDAYWFLPGDISEHACAWAAEIAYDGIVGLKVTDEFSSSHRGKKWAWNTTWRRKSLIERCRTRDMTLDGTPPGDYEKLQPKRGPDPNGGRAPKDLPPLPDKFTVQMCRRGTGEFRAHEAATLAAIDEYWAVPGNPDEKKCAIAACNAYLSMLALQVPEVYADPSVDTLWDWEWRMPPIVTRARTRDRSMAGPQHSGPIPLRFERLEDEQDPEK